MPNCHIRIYLAYLLVLFHVSDTNGTLAMEERKRQPKISELRIGSLQLAHGDMEAALAVLKLRAESRILVGFEKALGEGNRISLDLNDPTVGEILDQLCEADPRYTYELTSSGVINVFPVGSKADPTNLLNIRVSSFVFRGKRLPHYIIRNIDTLAPELAEYLEKKRREFLAKTGIGYGTGGSDLRGDMDPEVYVELKNVTIRDILNSVVLLSLDLSKKYTYLSPVGWKYEFVNDPNAPTGLGGYGKWDVF